MAGRGMPYRTLRLTLSALLLSVMLILGYIESLLPPIGLPGIKLGLSNGVLIFAVYMLDLPAAWVLMGLKVLLSGLLFGGVSAMFYALAGGMLSLAGMSLLSRIPALHPVVTSVAGGILHNIGQLGMAMLIAQLPMQFLVYMLILVGAGAVSGALTGTASTLVMRHLKAGGFRPARRPAADNAVAAVIAVALLIAAAVIGWQHVEKNKGMETVAPAAESEDAPAPMPTVPALMTVDDIRKLTNRP